MIESYLATYDYNLPLRDAERDPELSPRRRMLAAIGCHVALDSGYYDAQSLAAGLLDIASEPCSAGGQTGPRSDPLIGLAPRAGFEPATQRLTAACSTTELPGIKAASGAEAAATAPI